jgi:predicted nucleotidyltransferase
MKAREGDLLENAKGLIFDVKGLVHPPGRVVAFPRFIPTSQGIRKRGGVAYKKVYPLSERFEFLETHFPHYLVFDLVFGSRLCEVPTSDIKHYYDPVERLGELRGGSHLDNLEVDALHFLEILQDQAMVPWDKLGVSGSLLVKLHNSKSDIDLIVYGIGNCNETYAALKSLAKDAESVVKTYSREELKVLYDFRSRDTQVPFNDFAKTEHRKVLQGKFLQRDYFIRCIKDWDEVEERYGDTVCEEIGHAKIRATVSNDSEAIFTPCRYSVENVRLLGGKGGEAVTEVASFRGRFCEQAVAGEKVVAQGKVEKVQRKDGETFFRLLLGGKPSDFMALEG